MSLTEAEFQILLRNRAEARGIQPQSKAAVQQRRGQMNKWEAKYAETLAAQLRTKEVEWYEFEPFKLRLAVGAHYTPDFAVMRRGPCGSGEWSPYRLEFHEVKGFWREAARVRIKVAADKYPFPFYAVKLGKNGAWEFERIWGRAC